MFCIKCGSPAVAENFCERCFLHGKHLFEIESFHADFCKQCGTFHKGPIEEQIKSSVKTKNRINKCDIKTRRIGNRIVVFATCSGYIRPLKNPVTENRKSDVFTKNRLCENCIKISGRYHEAIFQIRGSGTEKILKRIMHFLPSSSIVDVKRIKEGCDILVTDKKLASRVATVLRGNFEIKSSYKLVGEKNGKELYRNYYAIR